MMACVCCKRLSQEVMMRMSTRMSTMTMMVVVVEVDVTRCRMSHQWVRGWRPGEFPVLYRYHQIWVTDCLPSSIHTTTSIVLHSQWNSLRPTGKSLQGVTATDSFVVERMYPPQLPRRVDVVFPTSRFTKTRDFDFICDAALVPNVPNNICSNFTRYNDISFPRHEHESQYRWATGIKVEIFISKERSKLSPTSHHNNKTSPPMSRKVDIHRETYLFYWNVSYPQLFLRLQYSILPADNLITSLRNRYPATFTDDLPKSMTSLISPLEPLNPVALQSLPSTYTTFRLDEVARWGKSREASYEDMHGLL